MILGLSGDEWTALGSIAAVLGLLLSLGSLRRRSANRSTAPMTHKAPDPATANWGWPPDIRMNPEPTSIRLRKVDSGSTLLNIIGPAAMYQLDHEEPGTPDEAEQVADALSTIHSWAESGDDGDPGDRVRAGFELTQLIQDLDEAGWGIYAAKTPRKVVRGQDPRLANGDHSRRTYEAGRGSVVCA